MRWTALCALATAVLVATGPAAAAPPAAQAAPLPPVPLQDSPAVTDQAPGTTSIAVGLTDAFIMQRLPFDVPFFVTGSVADATTRLSLSVYQVGTKGGMSALIANLQASGTCAPTGIAARVVSRSASRIAANKAFSLLVDALDPDRYYVFCFLSTAPVPATEIDVPVRAALVATVESYAGVAGDPTVAMGQSFHDDLSARISAIGAMRPDRAVIPAGNLFDPQLRVAAGTPIARLVVALRDPYGRAEQRRAEYVTTWKPAAVAALTALQSGPAMPFITATIAAILPATLPDLPLTEEAIRSDVPLDLGRFDFEPAAAALAAAAAGPAASNAAAVAALRAAATALDNARNGARVFGQQYERLRLAADDAVRQAALEANAVTVSVGSSVLSADLARNAYVSLDAGIAYSWQLENMVFYAGTNIYFRPINKAAPLRYKGSFAHRFALTVGVTTTVSDNSRRALDLRATPDTQSTSNSLLLGGGIRVTPSIRLGAGALVFKEKNIDPLITQTSVKVTPYVGMAADVDVASMLKSFFP